MKITLKNQINNDSVQIGDIAYFIPFALTASTGGIYNSTGDPLKIGRIDSIGPNYIEISAPENTPSDDDFIMFQKDKIVNDTSLLGYYAEVQLKNNSEEKAELFALSSEVATSSK